MSGCRCNNQTHRPSNYDQDRFAYTVYVTEDGKVNLGAMLRYVLTKFRSEKRDIKYHKNVVLVTSDSASDDDVLEPAQALRDMGVLVGIVGNMGNVL